MNHCILISTHDRYRPVAEFTRDMIDKYWKDHPQVFICGCSGKAGAGDLPLRDDPKDWIGILYSAAEDLLKAGYDKAYLIIDDCPPIFECNEHHLGTTLPGLMDRLKASHISLIGWDQRRFNKGEILGSDLWRVQKQAEDFPWRYSAGPGLWNLRALRDILSVLVPTDHPMSRSAWAFERRLGRGEVVLPEEWRNSSYRIYGWDMLGGNFPWLRKISRQVAYRVYDLCRFTVRWTAGRRALSKLDAVISIETYLYDGPYPTYWQGVMTKGRFNEDLGAYLKLHGRQDYLRDLLSHVAMIASTKEVV
jgi:hypothetical protein